MIKAYRGTQWLVLMVAIVTIGFSCKLKTSSHSDMDYILPTQSPSRVPNTQTNYISLLQSIEVVAVVSNHNSILPSVISPSLIASCESPLLVSDPLLSLHQVFALGNVVISNLLSCQDSTNISSIVGV